MISNITPLILTYNEAPNIGRVLERLTWATEIVVVDSFSTDDTLAIVRRFPQVRVVQRRFDDHTSQWNFAVEQVVTEWVLSLDADYVLSQPLIAELKCLPASPEVAYYAHFRYCIAGKPLRATLYPPRAVLFHRPSCRYVSDGHTQLLEVKGATKFLSGWIDHNDQKPLERWLQEQNRYAVIEAKHLLETPNTQLKLSDRLRKKIMIAPATIFFYTLIAKGLILDGWPGWYYVFQRTMAEMILSLKLMEQKLRKRGD